MPCSKQVYVWEAPRLSLLAEIHCTAHRFDVKLFRDAPARPEEHIPPRRHRIQLQTTIGSDALRIDDLVGNGFDSGGAQRQGYGTLAVHIAIPWLQQRCASTLPVSGFLSHPTEGHNLDEARQRFYQDNRRRFWQSLGLSVITLDGLEHLTGTVGDLRFRRPKRATPLPVYGPPSKFRLKDE